MKINIRIKRKKEKEYKNPRADCAWLMLGLFFFSHKTEEEISQPTEPNIPFLSLTLEIQVYVGPQLLAGRADRSIPFSPVSSLQLIRPHVVSNILF